MTRLTHLLFLSALLALAGCPDEAGDDDTAGDDDDATADDDDATGDDDDATADDDDDTTGDDDDDMTWPVEPQDGTVMLVYSTSMGVEVVFFQAFFWDLDIHSMPETALEPPDTMDECSVFVGTWDDLAMTGEMEPLNAGVLTLTGPTGSWEVTPTGGQDPYYQEMYMASEFEFEASYDLAGSGLDLAAFEETGALYLPAPTLLTAPDPSETLHVGSELEVTWSGSGEGQVLIQITAQTVDDQAGMVYCWADNDGAFTVPASALSQMPADSEIGLTFMDVVMEPREIDGRSITFWGGSVYYLMTQDIPG